MSRLWFVLITVLGWFVSSHTFASFSAEEATTAATATEKGSSTTHSFVHERRSLQFDGMFIGDNYEFYNQNPKGKGKKGQRAVNPPRLRAANLKRAVLDILTGTNKLTNKRACMHTCMYTYIHTYIHAYIHTYTYTYTYSPFVLSFLSNSLIAGMDQYNQWWTGMLVHTHTYVHTCSYIIIIHVRIHIHTPVHTRT